MTLDRCGSKGNHDVTGGEAVRMPIKLWEPVEKSFCILKAVISDHHEAERDWRRDWRRAHGSLVKVRSISERTLAMLLHTILLIPLCKP